MEKVVYNLHLALRHPVDAGDRIQPEPFLVENLRGQHHLSRRNRDIEIESLQGMVDALDRSGSRLGGAGGGNGQRGPLRQGRPGRHRGCPKQLNETLGNPVEGGAHSCSLATGKRRLPVSFSSSFRMPSINASGRGGQPGT